ncbi:hypothetical protein EPA93_33890 [Ktedonosporobacter rubrisoli]|uniref:Enoyl reductase (ER) domain-containing protein n=1 Tax=Ktedonosporobacter rubrisoli TaxID=2509675 RepID=A0A4P6JY32_KTERU|nr:zinc-binding dehydrogenase [Ktedonosporobacter rubrisoli]QBD80698.1 hypothetical protein EPA93_33890 [Ktedonosporobacter rubrisoli]
MRLVKAHKYGVPEVLQVVEQAEPQLGPGQVMIKVMASGIGFGETFARRGKYPSSFPLPFEPGWEVGGQIIHVGEGVDPSLVGLLVLASNSGGRGYADLFVVNADAVLPVPAKVSIEQATAAFLSGQVAFGVLSAVRVQPGETVLITAAAGAIGSLLLQLAKAAGAGAVIGAARGKEKGVVLSQLGADATIDYSEDNWVERVREITGGKGADVVIDSVGGAIGRGALDATANVHGRLGIFGISSGAGITIETLNLARRGITVVGALGIMMAAPEQEKHAWSREVLSCVAAGRLRAVIGQTYPLEQAAEAHAALEERRTIGKVLLLP